MPKVRHLKDVMRVARRALSAGATVEGPGRILWKASGGCTDPFGFTLTGRGAVRAGLDQHGDVRELSEFNENLRPYVGVPEYSYDGVVWVDIEAPCRRCAQCLRRRAADWAKRARSEIGRASRTWFGTFTLEPEEQWLAQLRAEAHLRENGVCWSDLDEDEQFLERHKAISRDFTLYFKRVRKGGSYFDESSRKTRYQPPSSLRYVLVAEKHKSGDPHYHALIHETPGTNPVVERWLRKQWLLGISEFTLVKAEDDTARYVAKYLSKSNLARVRASVGYGNN